MKTKIKVEVIVQQLYKVKLTSPSRNGWYYLTADSDVQAIDLTREAYPTYKIGECYTCSDNQSICWS